MITYERKERYDPIRSSLTKVWYVVNLHGKRVGTINQAGNGWRYLPKGAAVAGPKFDSLNACKASLEGK